MCRQIHDMKNKTYTTSDLLTQAARELEQMRQYENKQQACHRNAYNDHIPFPPACLCLLRSIAGNVYCADCGATSPQWASISYGALFCLQCSGKHRRLGVQLSKVRSITMDTWSHKGVLAMLEGGNKQLNDFFDRHGLSSSSIEGEVVGRYETNASKFYRKNLTVHVDHVAESGEYKGRDWSRRRTTRTRRNKGKGRCMSTNCRQVEKKHQHYNKATMDPSGDLRLMEVQ